MLSELSSKGFSAPGGRLLKVEKNGFETERRGKAGEHYGDMLLIRVIQAAGLG